MSITKVLIVDDHDIVRAGVARLLSDVDSIKVIAEASSGEEAIQLSRTCQPDVILMDVRMPGIGGLEACRKLLQFDTSLKIIALTACDDEPFPSKFLQAGAVGYLTKGSSLDEMVLAINTVKAGKIYIRQDVAQKLALKTTKTHESSPFEKLSSREMQIMLMITSGQKVKDISEKLYLSAKTVNSYRYRLFEKLGINSDVELTHLAIKHNMLENTSAFMIEE